MAMTSPRSRRPCSRRSWAHSGVSEDEARPDATLMDDLGAESIDLLDILFRIERSTGVKIQASDLGDYIQGGIPDDQFSDENETITDQGLEHLKQIMPQIDTAALRGNARTPTT